MPAAALLSNLVAGHEKSEKATHASTGLTAKNARDKGPVLLGLTATKSRHGHSYLEGAEHPQLLHSLLRPCPHCGVNIWEPSDKADDPFVGQDLVDRLSAGLAVGVGGRKLGN